MSIRRPSSFSRLLLLSAHNDINQLTKLECIVASILDFPLRGLGSNPSQGRKFSNSTPNKHSSNEYTDRTLSVALADPGIRLGGQLHTSPSIARLFHHWREVKVYSETGWRVRLTLLSLDC